MLLLEAWWPFNFSLVAARPGDRVAPVAWLPFSSLSTRHRIDVESYARKFGGFVPVGLLLASLWDPRAKSAASLLRILLVAAGLGVLIQAGRYNLPGRSIDSGDVLVNLGGALLGASPIFYAHLSRRTLGLLTLAFAAFFLLAATWPWHFSLRAASLESLSHRVEWLLFPGPITLGILRERALNALVTLPLGLLYATYALRGGQARRVLKNTAWVGFSCSITVEFLQCFLPHRTPSLTDVWLNTLGTLAGGGVAFLFERWRWRQPEMAAPASANPSL